MKKAIIAAVVIIALGFLMSSCNKHYCPAYAQNDTEQVENPGS